VGLPRYDAGGAVSSESLSAGCGGRPRHRVRRRRKSTLPGVVEVRRPRAQVSSRTAAQPEPSGHDVWRGGSSAGRRSRPPEPRWRDRRVPMPSRCGWSPRGMNVDTPVGHEVEVPSRVRRLRKGDYVQVPREGQVRRRKDEARRPATAPRVVMCDDRRSVASKHGFVFAPHHLREGVLADALLRSDWFLARSWRTLL
jgi:hypothetical protein